MPEVETAILSAFVTDGQSGREILRVVGTQLDCNAAIGATSNHHSLHLAAHRVAAAVVEPGRAVEAWFAMPAAFSSIPPFSR